MTRFHCEYLFSCLRTTQTDAAGSSWIESIGKQLFPNLSSFLVSVLRFSSSPREELRCIVMEPSSLCPSASSFLVDDTCDRAAKKLRLPG